MAEVKKDKKIKKEPKERKRLTPSLAPIAKIDVVKLGATKNSWKENEKNESLIVCLVKCDFNIYLLKSNIKKG